MREQMVRLNEAPWMDTARALKPWWNTRLEEDRVDGAEKGASSAIAGPSSSTAAPNVSPDCTRRRAVLVRRGYAGASRDRGVCSAVSGGGRSFWVKSYDLWQSEARPRRSIDSS